MQMQNIYDLHLKCDDDNSLPLCKINRQNQIWDGNWIGREWGIPQVEVWGGGGGGGGLLKKKKYFKRGFFL